MKRLRNHEKEITIALEKGTIDMLAVIDRARIADEGVNYVQRVIVSKCNETDVPNSASKWDRFWAYFSRTRVRKYKPELWNVHGLDNQLVARTNNPLERLNRELNAAFPTPHPTMPVFVAVIEQLSRNHVQRCADTPTRSRRQQRLAIQLPAAVTFVTGLSVEESEMVSDAGHDDATDYSDDSDSDDDGGGEGSAEDGDGGIVSNVDEDSHRNELTVTRSWVV